MQTPGGRYRGCMRVGVRLQFYSLVIPLSLKRVGRGLEGSQIHDLYVFEPVDPMFDMLVLVGLGKFVAGHR